MLGGGACGAGFLVLALLPGLPPKARWATAGLAAFCGLLFAAGAFPRVRPVVGRAVGSCVLALFVGAAAGAWANGGGPQAWTASAGLVLFGPPAAYAAATGRYPRWGRGAAFLTAPDPPGVGPAGTRAPAASDGDRLSG